MTLQNLDILISQFPLTLKMPLLFLGHGSPMNAIEENQFVAGFRHIAKTIQKTESNFMYFGTLVYERNKSYCYEIPSYDSRFWRIS